MSFQLHRMTFAFLVGLAPLAGLAGGCALPASDAPADEAAPGTAVSAVRGANWKGHKAKGHGSACKFQDDASGPADAFVIANGSDVAVVFTRLGADTKVGPKGRRVWSRCAFEIPLEVPQGSYLSGWSQSMTYGIVKPAGVKAGLGLDSLIDTGGPGASGQFGIPSMAKQFEKDAVLDVPLETTTAQVEHFDAQRNPQWKKRWCKHNRPNETTFGGNAYTWTERTKDNLIVEIAIDGLDAHMDLGVQLQACP